MVRIENDSPDGEASVMTLHHQFQIIAERLDPADSKHVWIRPRVLRAERDLAPDHERALPVSIKQHSLPSLPECSVVPAKSVDEPPENK